MARKTVTLARWVCAWAAGLSAASVRTASADERVVIRGGGDGTGHNYSWTVENRHSAPITLVEFPHFRADLFQPPPDWKQECTNLMVAGQAREPGVCRAWVEAPDAGIRTGKSVEFTMRIAREGAQRRTGVVLVRFADGGEARIPDVEVPTRESVPERFVALFGMAAVVALLIWWHSRARPKSRAASGGGAD